MEEKDLLFSRCLDAKKKALDSFMITSTAFLSVDERSLVGCVEREYNSDISTFYFGGYDEAERTVAVFVPKIFGVEDIGEYFSENPDDCPFCLLKVSKDRFSSLNHRDYLGSLMGLGIKRETVGDIIPRDDCTFIFALKSISRYICENLTKVGRGTVNCEICPLSEFIYDEGETETVFSSVASLRLDSVVSSAFNLSRTNSSLAVKSGLVYINSQQILKNDYTLREKDKIVLRGKGKVVLEEIIGESKKGRIHINIKKFK